MSMTDRLGADRIGCFGRLPAFWLAAVALVYATLPLVVVGPGWPLGIDETVYLSQINSFVPAAYFSAPRARGMTLIAAPVTLVTDSVVAVRIWMSLLAGTALYFSFRPWLRLRDGMLVPAAAALFGSLWMVQFYVMQAMPNQWVGFCVLAALGFAGLYIDLGGRTHLITAAGCLAAAALIRPSDAAFALVGLLAAVLPLPGLRLRRVQVSIALTIGAALGASQWIVEAYTRFNGLHNRIEGAQAENGGGGLHFTLETHASVLNGTRLCPPGCRLQGDPIYVIWWGALALLLTAGLVAAGRRGLLRVQAAPFVVGLAMAAQYLFTVENVAPRFLVPTYLLWSLPVAFGGRALICLTPKGLPRALGTSVLIGAFVTHLLVQLSVFGPLVERGREADRRLQATAGELRSAGLRPPCLILGRPQDQNLYYELRCRNQLPASEVTGPNARIAWFGKPTRAAHSLADEWWRLKRSTGAEDRSVYLNFQPET